MGKIDFYNKLIIALRLVASSSKVQISVLPNFVNVPDDIALIYNDAYIAIYQLWNQNLISKEALEILENIDSLFEEMSRDSSLWTIDRLENDTKWKFSRELASSALNALHELYDNPNLNFIQWIQ